MRRRELSLYEFADIHEALELTAESLREEGNIVAAVKVDDLRKLFEDAHTGWLWFEDEEEGNENG